MISNEKTSNPLEESIPFNWTSPTCVSVTMWSYSGHNLGEGDIASHQKVWDFHRTRLCQQPSYFWQQHEGILDDGLVNEIKIVESDAVPVRNLHAAFDYFLLHKYDASVSLSYLLHFLHGTTPLSYVQVSKWVSPESQVKINGCQFYTYCTPYFLHLQIAMRQLWYGLPFGVPSESLSPISYSSWLQEACWISFPVTWLGPMVVVV